MVECPGYMAIQLSYKTPMIDNSWGKVLRIDLAIMQLNFT